MNGSGWHSASPSHPPASAGTAPQAGAAHAEAFATKSAPRCQAWGRERGRNGWGAALLGALGVGRREEDAREKGADCRCSLYALLVPRGWKKRKITACDMPTRAAVRRPMQRVEQTAVAPETKMPATGGPGPPPGGHWAAALHLACRSYQAYPARPLLPAPKPYSPLFPPAPSPLEVTRDDVGAKRHSLPRPKRG